MAIRLNPGDMVKLTVPVEPLKVRDVDGNEFWIAETRRVQYECLQNHLSNSPGTCYVCGQPVHPKSDPGAKLTLFEAHLGTYLGECRRKMHDSRTSRGVVRRLYQRFFFNESEVMVEPQFVDVFLKVEDLQDGDD